MNKPSGLTGHTAHTPDRDLPSSEFLAGLVQRLSRPDNATRTFTPDTLRTVLLMSARLTHECAKYNRDASQAWHENRHGNYHTKDARTRAIRDANDLADYAWDEATRDAEAAYALLVTPDVMAITAADLVDSLTADEALRRTVADPTVRPRRLIAAGIKRGSGQLVVKAVAA